ncbi:hypothetical protein ACJROX_14470 [Pseudalkalibacillus sp. A8]|uniref:hypothetical protein n=1 Tax=Pseudalkalibacillus sp. A8 TaxID=3382641 RepID=UPI0038B50A7A
MMETIYEIQRIRQVISELEGGQTHIIRSPEDDARVAAGFIGEDDRKHFLSCASIRKTELLLFIVAT